MREIMNAIFSTFGSIRPGSVGGAMGLSPRVAVMKVVSAAALTSTFSNTVCPRCTL
jgi:hypothetical protein